MFRIFQAIVELIRQREQSRQFEKDLFSLLYLCSYDVDLLKDESPNRSLIKGEILRLKKELAELKKQQTNSNK